MAFTKFAKVFFGDVEAKLLADIDEKLRVNEACREAVLLDDDDIVYCEVHNSYHQSCELFFMSNSENRRFLYRLRRYTRATIAKLSKIILELAQGGRYFTILNLLKYDQFARRNQRIAKLMVEACKKAYKNHELACRLRFLLREARETALREYRMTPFCAKFADVLVDPDVPPNTYESDFVPSVLSYVAQKKRRPRVELSDLWDVVPTFKDTTIQRSSALLLRLREKIREFRIKRLSHRLTRTGANSYLRSLAMLSHREPLVCRAESDSPQDEKGGTIASTDVKQNVELAQARVEDVETPTVSVSSFWSETSSTDVKGTYNEMTERWIEFTTFEWNKDMGQHTIIGSYDLPRDLFSIDNGTMCSRPNTIPFQVHRYYKTDLDIKIQVNANKFQIGQLICAWYYSPQFDDNFDSRLRFQCLSTTNHVLITANISNEAELRIPYQYYAPYLSSRDRDDMPKSSIMGKLVIMVANPLTVPNSGPSKCFGTVFIRFKNCEFTGMIAGNVGKSAFACEAEGDSLVSLLGDVAGVALNYLSDNNRDNPPNPNPPAYLVPTASHSWSVGTGMSEPLHPLRLDGRGQTPHPLNGIDEMNIQSIASTYGYVTTIEWNKDQAAGTLLDDFDAAPMLDKLNYIKQEHSDENHLLPAYYIPPVAVVSSLFNYWRGSIKFRFDFICSQFHTGRLLIAYVPGARETDTITLAQAKSSPHIVFTLNEQQSITYEIPFISNKTYWSRFYTGNFDREQVPPPSTVYVFVLNPLVPMEAVSEKLYINVWMAGGGDFEVAVPIQPSIGLNFDRTVLYKDTQMVFSTNSTSIYAGVWKNFLSSMGLIMRNGTTSNATATFDDRFEKKTTAKIAFYYELYDEASAPYYKDTDGVLKPVKYGVMVTDNTYWYMAVVRTAEDAITAVRLMRFEKKAPSDIVDKFVQTNDTTSNTWSTGNPGWLAHEVHKDASWVVVPLHSSAESDDKLIFDSGKSTARTDNGRMLFGERFFDFKDLCRRYQAYASFVIDTQKQVQIGQCSIVLPVLPQGLALNVGTTTNIIELSNRCRDGIIPIVASGFRWFRGGIRFRLVIPSRFNALVWVQHRPDRGLRSRQPISCTEVVTAEAVANHGYATYLQLTTVNGCVEFEVPFYQPGMFGMLQKSQLSDTEEKYFFSLGEVAIGFIMNQSAKNDAKNMLCSLYYSIADDMRFYTFQGFPPMILCDDITDVKMVSAEGPLGWLSPTSVVNNAITQVKQAAAEETVPILTEIHNTLESMKTSINNTSFTDVISSPSFRCAISNLVHGIINPTVNTIAWALASFFVEIGLVVVTSLEALINTLTKYIKTFIGAASSEPNKEEQASVSAESPHDNLTERQEAASGFLTIMWTTLCGILGCRQNMREGKSWAKFLSMDMGNIFKSSNALFQLIRNIMCVWHSMYNRIIEMLYPGIRRAEMLADAHESMKKWVEEVLFLTDPELKTEIPYDAGLIDRVYSAHTYGMSFISDMATDYKAKELAIMRQCYSLIVKLKDELIALGKDPHVRKMPFTVCVSGLAGIGKSHMMSETVCELLKSQNYKLTGPMTCVINTASKFWDQCERQPVLVMDDLFAVETGQILENQIQWLFSIVSPVPLSPPMAEITDKKMRYNPEIFWYNTNKPFIKIDRVNQTALWRRRDVLLDVRHINWETESKKDCEHCINKIAPDKLTDDTKHLLDDYHHLRFYFYEDVCNPNEKKDKYVAYPEFLELLKIKFGENRIKANRTFRREVERQMSLMGDAKFYPQSYKESVADIERKAMYYKVQQAEKTISAYFGSKYLNMKNYIESKLYTTSDVFLNAFGLSIEQIKAAYNDSQKEQEEIVAMLDDSVVTMGVQSEGPDGSVSVKDLPMANATVASVFESLHRLCTDNYNTVQEMQKNDRMWSRANWDLSPSMLEELKKFVSVDSKILSVPQQDKMVTFLDEVFKCYSGLGRPKWQKDWTDVFESWRLFSSPTSFSRACGCYQLDPTEIDYKSVDGVSQFVCSRSGSVLNGAANLLVGRDSECENEYCPFSFSIYRYFFWRKWLKFTPARSRAYIRKDITVVPKELYVDGMQKLSFPDIETWRNIMMAKVEALYLKYLKEPARRLWKVFKTIWPLVAGVLGIAGVVFGGVQAYKNRDKIPLMKEKFIESMKAYKPNLSWAESTVYDPAVPKAAPRASAKPAQGQASQQFECMIDRLKRNFVEITVSYQLRNVTYTCLIVRGRQCLMLRHFVEEIDYFGKDAEVYIKPHILNSSHHKYGVKVDFSALKRLYYNNVRVEGNYLSNFVIVDLPLCILPGKNLVDFIARGDDHKYVNSYGSLVTPKCVYTGLALKRCDAFPHVVESTDVISSVIMEDVYTYPVHGKGMCGSVLLDPNSERPIIGIHVAGMVKSGEYGIAEILAAEMFDPIPPPPEGKVAEPNFDIVDVDEASFETALYPVGRVDKKYAQVQSPRSSIHPSRIHGVFPVTQEPNPLSEFDSRLPPGNPPLLRGVENMGRPPLDFKTDVLDLCYEDLKIVILNNVKPVRAKIDVLNMQVAVCGNPNIKGFDKLEFSTSAGYPLNSHPDKRAGKRWLFDLIEDEKGHLILKGVHPDLKLLLDLNYSMRLKGVRPFTIFADCLKDTTLPKEKCRIIGKTRIFSIAPVQFTIMFKMYFLDFMASYQNARFDAEHAIGINVQSLEWTELATRLLTNGRRRIITGDYKNFGPGLMRKAVDKAFDIIIDWYAAHGAPPEDQEVRKIMKYEILDAPHLMGNLVYMAPCGIPSGSPITTPLNSLVNSLYIRYVYSEIVKKPFSYLHENSCIVTYGDDVLISVSDELSEKFNTESMSTEFAKYGIVFTDADKTDNIIKYRRILDSSFLKRKFAPHPAKQGVWVGLLEKASIENSVNWTHKKHYEDDDILKGTCSAALLSSFEWGEEYYNHIGCTLSQSLRERNISWTYESWKSLNRHLY